MSELIHERHVMQAKAAEDCHAADHPIELSRVFDRAVARTIEVVFDEQRSASRPPWGAQGLEGAGRPEASVNEKEAWRPGGLWKVEVSARGSSLTTGSAFSIRRWRSRREWRLKQIQERGAQTR